MNINRCRTCEHFDSFFYSCNLQQREVYIDEGEIDTMPMTINDVSELDCEYSQRSIR